MENKHKKEAYYTKFKVMYLLRADNGNQKLEELCLLQKVKENCYYY
jgi:hypothetical protein